MVLPPSQTDSTFWFDNEAGLTRKAEFTSSGGMSFDVAAPDEEGEIMEFGLNLTVNQTMAYRLVGS